MVSFLAYIKIIILGILKVKKNIDISDTQFLFVLINERMLLGEWNMFNTDRIKEIRLSKNLTQNEVAKQLHVTRSSYAMWESNNNIIPLKRLIALSDFLEVNLDYLFGFSNKLYSIKKGYNLEVCAQRLKEFRKENKITQVQLCKFLHIDQPTWSIYETGKNLIGTPFLYDICKKYHISADYLLGKIDSPRYLK